MTKKTRAHGRTLVPLLCGVQLMSAAALSILALTAARADDADSATAAQRAKGDQPDLQEIIVTANKRAEDLQSIGAGISVVSDERLDQFAANSLAGFIQDVPGVNLQSYGAPGYGSIEIRGISPQSVGATVSTYIDNIPIGGSSAVGENGDFLPDLDPADIQRVEVLKGPQGTLYGASSLGGVIKYVTKQPSLTQPEANVTEEFEQVDHGQFGGKMRASASTPVTDDLAVRLSGYYRWIPGYIDDVGVSGKDANNGYDWGIRATALWKPTSDLSINVNAMQQESRQNAFDNVDLTVATLRPLYGDLSQLRYTPEFMAYKTSLYSAEINFEQPYGSFLSASSFNAIHPTLATDLTPYYTGLDGIGPSAPASGIGHHDDQQETEELRFTSNRLGKFEFLTGLFFQHESLTDGTNYVSFEPGGLTPNPSVPYLGYGDRGGTLNEYAGFFNTTYYIVPSLDVTFGYRYSDILQNRVNWDGGVLYEGNNTTVVSFDQSSKQSSDTYMAGARWHITDDVMVYLRAACGYRPGGVRTPLPGAPPDFGNVYYSDNIWSYEPGLKVKAVDGRLTVDTGLFWINWDNIQALVIIGQFNTDGNGGHALSRGVETQATYVPVNSLTLRANFSYTDAFFKYADPSVLVTSPGQRLFFVPELQGSLSADYNWSMGKFKANAGGDWSYTGDQYDISNFLLPSYSVVNAHAGLKWNNETLNLYVRNLADKRAIVGDTGYYPAFYSLYTVTVN